MQVVGYGIRDSCGNCVLMWQIMVFFFGALVLAGFSSRFFSTPRSHGFFRFLAFVAIWAVLVTSLPWWFQNMDSPWQIVSWILLALALALALSAYHSLRTAARIRGIRRTPTEPGSTTPGLATKGPYRYIRHPLYASLVLFTWGLALKSRSFAGISLGLLAAGLLYLTALLEEEENLDRFGAAYEEYMSVTRMFVPGLF